MIAHEPPGSGGGALERKPVPQGTNIAGERGTAYLSSMRSPPPARLQPTGF